MKRVYALVFLVIFVLGSIFFFSDFLFAEKSEARTLTWVIAHQPVDLFDRAARTFTDEFNARSDGLTIEISVLGPSDIDGSGAFNLSSERVFGLLDAGEADIVTMTVAALQQSYPRLGVLTLPYVFEDYDSAAEVLDGEVGSILISGVSDATTARGLAFTLSGGFNIILSRKAKIESSRDFEKVRIATANGPLARDALSTFGAEPVAVDAKDGTAALMNVLDDGADGAENTYTRLSIYPLHAPAVINETNHSIFLTMILANDAFFESLSPHNQAAFEAAARAAARVEREDSIALAEKTRGTLEKNGIEIVTMTPEKLDELRQIARNTYPTYEALFGKELIEMVTAAHP